MELIINLWYLIIRGDFNGNSCLSWWIFSIADIFWISG